jgi:hypothetical protein
MHASVVRPLPNPGDYHDPKTENRSAMRCKSRQILISLDSTHWITYRFDSTLLDLTSWTAKKHRDG